MKKMIFLLNLLLCFQVLAVSQAPQLFNKSCPDKFIAKVSATKSLGVPQTSPLLEKIRVEFSVLQVERGTVKDHFTLDVLKFGPTQFETDMIYDLETSQGFLCLASKVENE